MQIEAIEPIQIGDQVIEKKCRVLQHPPDQTWEIGKRSRRHANTLSPRGNNGGKRKEKEMKGRQECIDHY